MVFFSHVRLTQISKNAAIYQLLLLPQNKTIMKRNIFNILLLAGAAVVFSSCKDDDDDKKTPNVFKVGEVSTTITAGLFRYDTEIGGADDDIYMHEIVLVGEGLSWDSNGEAQGQGNGLSLGIISATTALEVGTYEFTGTDEVTDPFDFWTGDAFTDLFTDSQQEYDFTEGTIVIAKSGDVYTIDVTGAAGETAITGHFSGKLTSIEKVQ